MWSSDFESLEVLQVETSVFSGVMSLGLLILASKKFKQDKDRSMSSVLDTSASKIEKMFRSRYSRFFFARMFDGLKELKAKLLSYTAFPGK